MATVTGRLVRPDIHRKHYKLKVILTGDYGVGKSTLATRFSNSVRNGRSPVTGRSIQAVFERDLQINDDSVILRVMDTVGQERYRSITVSYYRGAHCCFLVFDVSNRKSMDNISNWYDELNRCTQDGSVTTILVGLWRKSHAREVTQEQGESYAEHLDMPYFEVDLENESQVVHLFEIIANSAVQKYKCKSSLSSSSSKTSTHAQTMSGIKISRLAEMAKSQFMVCSC